ncbi:hypothetical protein F5B22DRAFT_499447 [Xylaria bambusicola]|uniref:uncharacterized protein n=1 Tax=Xylaria bambusicola TaxID=326684 RepID=UPI0020081BFC|nr:uncharacterized protein F5B22DRAFT_499447 [Xylaria bambusicola]KAI0505704.1 hypothetical protein F5B22DRAFT_499447 [Xylaria bambusicola]
MALLGWSLILASVVYIAIRRPPLIDTLITLCWPSPNIQYPPPREGEEKDEVAEQSLSSTSKTPSSPSPEVENAVPKLADTNPTIPVFNIASSPSSTPSSSPQTTPKVRAATVTEHGKENANGSIPSFSLSSTPIEPPASAAALARASSNPPTPRFSSPSSITPPPTMSMPPPPRPPKLNDVSAPSSSLLGVPQSRPSPLPNRSNQQYDRQPGTSTLAPPPTHSSKPSKPSRKVTLEPGHSPLDWARLANNPTADLRGLGSPNAPYLRVTPSMLRRQTGRRGKDAWTALGGRVYNMTPYLPFHPGGEPELLRAAGRDGTKLFGEIHPWVNYETMLSSCLVGLMVEEGEAQSAGDMEAMD